MPNDQKRMSSTMHLNLLIITIFIIFNSSTCFSLTKNDLWESIEGENLKFSQMENGLILKNDTQCEVKDIEIQTYPKSSNSVTRIMGIGSYYYKIDSLNPGKTELVYWDNFSNTEGKYLNTKEYAFNRVSFSADKFPGKNKKHLNEHYKLWASEKFLNFGFGINVENKCNHPIKFAIRIKDLKGEWNTEAWYSFKALESSYLKGIKTRDSRYYYYAETSDASNIYWGVDDNYFYISLKKYGMRTGEDMDGDTNIVLTCN
ncbi:MAG: DUF1036 domain-containing protein [Gammaproteobacteria bacterium]|nr:DUF1036 domain-containing protein [Gammaproteobacteria bacterium]